MNSTMCFINQKAENIFPAQKHLKIFIILYNGCEFLKIHVCYFLVQVSLTHGLLPVLARNFFNERKRCMLGTLGLQVCVIIPDSTWVYGEGTPHLYGKYFYTLKYFPSTESFPQNKLLFAGHGSTHL